MRRRSPGFTLVELLAVLLILALVAAAVIPSIGRSSAVEVRGAARTLVSGLRRARSHALTQLRAADFAVDVERREFRLPGEPEPRTLPERIDLTLFTARSRLESESSGAIRFFPDGSSTGGRITVSGGGQRYLVDVDWLTGKVSARQVAGDG
ncbi:MAG: GspH/FimT family protein [Gammaproteobacteria bacterium]|nr:GspH/FimT family protein [Gammaproteobacteria bacterium]